MYKLLSNISPRTPPLPQNTVQLMECNTRPTTTSPGHQHRSLEPQAGGVGKRERDNCLIPSQHTWPVRGTRSLGWGPIPSHTAGASDRMVWVVKPVWATSSLGWWHRLPTWSAGAPELLGPAQRKSLERAISFVLAPTVRESEQYVRGACGWWGVGRGAMDYNNTNRLDK